MMASTEPTSNSLERALLNEADNESGLPISFKRIVSRAIRNWYLIVLSVMVALTIAFLFNRYTTRIYPVTASIIVREENENSTAEFLYQNNPLMNPYRNFYNELYIMRSIPLLQEVVEKLNFTVSWYREGNIKTSEVYDPNFPVQIRILHGAMPYGRAMGFRVESEHTFALQYLSEDSKKNGDAFTNLQFGDTVAINGYRLLVTRSGALADYIGKYYIVRFTDPFQLAKQYATRLKASWAEQGSSVVNLDINGPLPDKDKDFIQTFIERYQQYDVDKKNETVVRSIQFLDDQLAKLGDSLKNYDTTIEDFKQTNLTPDFDAEAQDAYQRIEDLEEKKDQIALNEKYYEYLEDYISKGTNLDQVVPPSAVGIDDQLVVDLITKLTDLQFQLRMMGDQQRLENPLVIENQKRIEGLKTDIREGINSIRQTQKINLQFLDKQIVELEKRLEGLPKAQRHMLNIQRDYTVSEDLFTFLLQKRAEASISKASTTSDIELVNPPMQKGDAITPKPLQNYTIAFAAGFVFPFVFFLLGELLNNKVQSKEDIERTTRIAILGGIGHNSYGEGNLAVIQKPNSALAESFRALRSNLSYFIGAKGKHIILVTSSISGEGKTFTTINLATVMAFAGHRVLIIGADMRRPRISEDFGLANTKGLSSYLSGLLNLQEVVQQTNIENLWLMSGGPVPPNPSELLLSPTTQVMFDELLKNFDFIILDTPPLGLVSDAFTLMPFADHTIFVVRQDYTPRYFIKDIQELFERHEVTKISILFNDIRKTGPGYGYGYGYGYAYGYGYNYGLNHYTKDREGDGYYTD